MAEFNEILGLGQDLEFQGKRYRITDDLTFGVQAEFERWLKSQAMLDAMNAPSQDEADKYRRIFFEDSAHGAFRFGGVRSRMALMGNFEASVRLLYLLMQDGHRRASAEYGIPSEAVARKMLDDVKLGPWAQAICLQALGLNPQYALATAIGLTLARAETAENQSKITTLQTLKAKMPKMMSEQQNGNSPSSEDFSGSIRDYLNSYLDSLGNG